MFRPIRFLYVEKLLSDIACACVCDSWYPRLANVTLCHRVIYSLSMLKLVVAFGRKRHYLLTNVSNMLHIPVDWWCQARGLHSRLGRSRLSSATVRKRSHTRIGSDGRAQRRRAHMGAQTDGQLRLELGALLHCWRYSAPDASRVVLYQRTNSGGRRACCVSCSRRR